MKQNPLKLKYTPAIWAVAVFYLILSVTMYLLFSKIHPQIRLNFAPFNTKEFNSHISNFIISCDLFTIIALIWLVMGASNKVVIWLGITIILINLFTERFVTILNTPDIVDAYFGIAGVILAGIVITITKLFGLKIYQEKSI